MSKKPRPWELEGPNVEAIKEVDRVLAARHRCANRPPDPLLDLPPVSTFPVTRAAREALRYGRQYL